MKYPAAMRNTGRNKWVVGLSLLFAASAVAATDVEKLIEVERPLLAEEEVDAIRVLDPSGPIGWTAQYLRAIERLRSLSFASRSAFRGLLWHTQVGDPLVSVEAFELVSLWMDRFPELRPELVTKSCGGEHDLEFRMARRLAEIALVPFIRSPSESVARRAAIALARSWLIREAQMPQSPAMKATVLLGLSYEADTCPAGLAAMGRTTPDGKQAQPSHR